MQLTLKGTIRSYNNQRLELHIANAICPFENVTIKTIRDDSVTIDCSKFPFVKGDILTMRVYSNVFATFILHGVEKEVPNQIKLHFIASTCHRIWKNKSWLLTNEIRYATTYEKLLLFEMLEDKNHLYDEKNKQLIPVKGYRPKVDEIYHFINDDLKVYYSKNCNSQMNLDHFKAGNCFKTEEEAEKVVEKIKNILNEHNNH